MEAGLTTFFHFFHSLSTGSLCGNPQHFNSQVQRIFTKACAFFEEDYCSLISFIRSRISKSSIGDCLIFFSMTSTEFIMVV